ncbi:DNA polymerase III subunit [Anaerotignum faecicola]|uniref:DNA polymerase III subunit delta' n=1 Tax=Anaerotignum faecicola TaxID=2358141 RepID=A0A401LFM9_9FIRM|nr:DNA polymerase III subunit [Anaerotignum faecicola]GCB30304.1 DNA polymerase III subunit delta' [Anaerotignum faecicola]
MYTFEEIRGNTPLVEQLRRSAASGRSSHAYLFLGGAGAGKRLIANTFAKALQCEGEKRPCDSCKSCHAFNHGNHPDVIYFQPLKNGKTYTIEDVREQLLETVDLKPFRYEKKIYIIEKADTLNIQSQNALLKTLEEPPAHAVFLLLAERAEAFLPTILSRVVVMKIRPLSAETIADYLMQAGHLAEESHILSAYAQGRIGQALELVEDEGFRKMRQDILGKLEALPSMSEGDAYLLAKDFEVYKNDLRFLDIMELWYRDLLTAKSLREEGYLIQRDKKDAIFRAAKEPAALLAKKAAAVRTARMRLAQNANFRLTMEVMLMDLKETGK